jgi:(4-(4-[2-(gamma-L-glutamylamino)ethyl]phenoxymethyl)furan-2-yl)methanamine synthase
MIMGLDIGGANTKAASADGRFTSSKYLPLWRGADLGGTLESIKKEAGTYEAIGVTITGELADCYASKKEGIEHISSSVKKIFPDAVFYGVDGRFHNDTSDHTLFSAANWMASARFLGHVHSDVLFIDIGSTTTDLIPIVASTPNAGMTDFERLARGELIYSGTLRTNIAALLQQVNIRGLTVRTASELFAVTGDVHLLLGHIRPEDYTCDTPDGAGKDTTAAARRLARVVCCDLEELSIPEATEIAAQAHGRQVEILKECIREVANRNGLKAAVICGLGEFLAAEALCDLGIPFTILSHAYGGEISRVFPAYAVAGLLKEVKR